MKKFRSEKQLQAAMQRTHLNREMREQMMVFGEKMLKVLKKRQ